MRKRFSLLILLLPLLANCELFYNYDTTDTVDVSYIDAQSPADVWEWICGNIDWEYDGTVYSKSPSQTLSDGVGNCEDQCKLMVYLCRELLGIECTIEFVRVGWGRWHTVVSYDGIIYDPSRNEWYSEK